ncbi:MAG: hypothetical protein JF590_03420 [Gemmatimonadetes bacterium]|nr:hypothetical protein [Gemmatimonadota bacterium]
MILALTVGGAPLRAQEPRLTQRLGAAAADSIARIIALAEREGLPAAPLNAKALEGAGRGASPARVIQAVTNLVTALRAARAALGAHHSSDELTAGAAALQNGVAADVLRQFGRTPAERSVTTPLVVLTDLVSRGVPRDTISALVTATWHRGISDQDLLHLRETISHDIDAGASPREAALLRLGAFGPTPLPPTGPAPASEVRP